MNRYIYVDGDDTYKVKDYCDDCNTHDLLYPIIDIIQRVYIKDVCRSCYENE